MDADMQKVFGATLESIEVRELIDMAKAIPMMSAVNISIK